MPPTGSLRTAVVVLGIGATAACLPGCGPSAPAASPSAASASCDEDDLPRCEAALADAIARGHDAAPLARAYVEARRRVDADDALVALVDAAPRGAGLVTLPGAARAKGAPALASVPRSPAALGPEGWLLVFAHATGTPHAIALQGDGRRLHAVAQDPLRPLLVGLPAVFRSTGALPIDDDRAAVAAVQTAFEAAGRFDYVAAAEAGVVLGRAQAARGEGDGLGLRARFAQSVLATAGISLEVEAPAEGAATPSAASTPSASTPAPPGGAAAVTAPPEETAYEAALAVRTHPEMRRAYESRRARLAAALGPALAAQLDAWIGIDEGAEGCVQASLPDFDDDRQLAFASVIATSLLPLGVDPANARGRAPLDRWYPRYEGLRRLAEREGLGFWAVSHLLFDRGFTGGVTPDGTPTYRAVTELAKKHLRGLAELTEHGEGRAGFAAITAVAALPGMREASLAPMVAQLAQRSTQLALGRAKTPEAVALALIGGISSALSYAPELQAAQLNALQGAFTAQLRGNLSGQRGWAVAGLHALDATYRLVASQSPNLTASSEAITKALGDPAIDQPGMAALATAATRYATLGATGELGAPVLEKGKDGPKPARAEARRALRDALSRLGDGATPPPGAALDDLTDLVDGAVSTFTHALAATPKTEPTAICTAEGPDPTTQRALGKLRDVRRRIVAATWFSRGDDAWSRRARLLVLLTSDVLDTKEGVDGTATFAISDATAAQVLENSFAGWAPQGVADVAVGAHGLARSVFATKPDEAARARSLRRLILGLRAALADEASGAVAGGGLLDVLASEAVLSQAGEPGASIDRDLVPALVREAERLSAAGDRNRSDMLLLVVAGLAAANTGGRIPDEAIALAKRVRSRTHWILVERDATARLREGMPLDDARLREALASAMPAACGVATTDLVADVAAAAGSFRAGRRDDARRVMRGVVERLEKAPAVLPRSNFRYLEHAGTRVLQLTLGLTPSAGLLTSSNTFQLGLGYQSNPAPRASLLHLAIDPVESPFTAETAARFTVHAASLAAIFELLGGDPRRAERAGALAYARATRGAPPAETSLAKDAAPAMLLAAQLFAEKGHAILAGDLLALVRSTLATESTDEDVATALEVTPLGLEGVAEAEQALERARKTLAVLVEKMPCTTAKVPLAAYETPRCEAYPLAIGLRIADSLGRLPRLAVVDAKTCAHASLDRFFGKMEGGGYDPDALGVALADQLAQGHAYEAVVLMTRLRPAEHCNPSIVASARALGGAEGLPPGVRADALTVALRCASDGGDEELLAIDRLLMAASDLERSLETLAYGVLLANDQGRLGPLHHLLAQPGYHDRWLRRNPQLAATTLALDLAVSTSFGNASGGNETDALARTLCTDFPSNERAGICTAIEGLRDTKRPLADRQVIAKEALRGAHALFWSAK